MRDEGVAPPFRWLRLLAAPVLAIAGLGLFGLWPSDSRAVRGRVEAAAEALSSRPGEPDIERLARLAGLSKLLASDILVESTYDGLSVRGRDAVAGAAAQLSGAAGPQQIELTDINVMLDEGRSRATVIALAHMTAATQGAASRYDGQPVRIELVKVSGEWLISAVHVEPALDR